MEGLGSRQGRASSRYGSGPSAPVFNGPVRKWKKQWVSSDQSNDGGGNKRNDTPPLVLCRWTPLSATAEEPRKRRFRYAPVVEIEKGNGENLEKVNNEAKARKNSQSAGSANTSGGIFAKVNPSDSPGAENQELGIEELESNGGRRMVINWED